MPYLSKDVLQAFEEALRKEAAIPWQALGGNVGSLLGAGAALGAGVGGIRRGVQAYDEAKEQGAGTGSAALGALGAGVGGAAKGALIGAGAGAGLGALGTHLAPELTGEVSKALTTTPGLGALGRFGQRQVHGFTGWAPEGGIGAIRGGAYGARAAEEAAKRTYADKARPFMGGFLPNTKQEAAIAAASKNLDKASLAKETAEEVERRGMTSIPGVFKEMRKDPLGTMGLAAKHQWRNSSLPEKAMMIGLPAVSAAGTLAAKEDPEHGKGERLGRSAAQLAGGMALGSVPLVGQVAGVEALGRLGSAAGQGIDHLRKTRPGLVHRRPELEPVDQQQHLPTEREMSPAAAGQIPESLSG